MDRIDEAVEAGLAAYNEGNADDLGGLIENVILAGMKVLLGEVAEYQYRFWNDEAAGGNGAWSGWAPIRKQDYERECVDPMEGREVRALYAPSLGEGDGR